MQADSRLETFRQIKRNIRGSERHLLVGIDIAKETHHAFFGTANGRTLSKKLVFDNSKAGYESLIAFAGNLKDRYNLSDVVYGLEPTGTYHKPLAEYLIRQDENVVYVSNAAVKNNRALLDGRWDKHDKKDAANVADLVGQARCLYYELPGDDLRELRGLLSYRVRLKRQEHGLSLRIRNNIFAQYFPALDRQYMRRGQPDEMILSIAEHCLDPRMIASMTFESFVKLVTKQKIRITQERRLQGIWEAAKETAGCLVHEAAKWEAKNLVQQLKTLREMVAENEERMRTVASRFPEYDCLLSIPGFGPIVSAMVLGTIGDAAKFNSKQQVLRLAGLDLSAARSGKNSDSAVPVISKQGKAALRYAIVQAAMVASISNPTIRTYYCKLLKGRECERGIKLKMKVKLAAKMLVIAWTLMKRKEQFKSSCFQV